LITARSIRPEVGPGGGSGHRRRRQGCEPGLLQLLQALQHLLVLAFQFGIALRQLVRLLFDAFQLGVGLTAPGVFGVDLATGGEDLCGLRFDHSLAGFPRAGQGYREECGADDERRDTGQQQVLAPLHGGRIDGRGISHGLAAP
jgi:hypothetical protein